VPVFGLFIGYTSPPGRGSANFDLFLLFFGLFFRSPPGKFSADALGCGDEIFKKCPK